MTHQLHIIKSQDDCSEFVGWLSEHPEITNVQGFGLRRSDSNRMVAFTFGTADNDQYYATAEWMYRERRMFNDWIKSYIHKHGDIVYGWWNVKEQL